MCVLGSVLLPGACRINANQYDTARESASSQAVTTEPAVCRLPKDTFIMHPYFGLEGQKSCSSLCQLIRKSIDRFAGVGWFSGCTPACQFRTIQAQEGAATRHAE